MTGDALPDIVVGTQTGTLYGVGMDGQLLPGFPVKAVEAIEGGPLLWDIDGEEYYPNEYAVWLDDKRPVPPQFEWHGIQCLKLAVCTTADAAIDILCKYNVAKISLDHDLGDEATCGTGYEVASFIEEAAFEGRLAPLAWAVHSQNPVGANRMRQALLNADEHWTKSANPL